MSTHEPSHGSGPGLGVSGKLGLGCDQALLLRARRISQMALDQLPEAVAVFSESGEVELVNATAASVLGLHPGQPLPAQHEPWISLLVAGERGVIPCQEVRSLGRDGREALFLPRAIPLGESSRRLGTLLILEDVTERRRSAELTSELLAAASRDLRNPLASLRAALDSLQGTARSTEGNSRGSLSPGTGERAGERGDGINEALASAVRDASRMAEVLGHLDAVARLEERRQDLRVQAASPRDLVETAAGEFRSSFERRGVKLAAGADPALPRVLADPERIRLTLGFLLDNALAATPAGGSVTVSAEAAGERVRFAVTDTGCGIPEEHQGRLFERFFQVPGSESRGRAGLGLSIAKDIVQSHGGEIHLESRVGRGTTVRFTLSVARKEGA